MKVDSRLLQARLNQLRAYVREEEMTKQVDLALACVALPQPWIDKMQMILEQRAERSIVEAKQLPSRLGQKLTQLEIPQKTRLEPDNAEQAASLRVPRTLEIHSKT